jgi:hypothetical protein
MAHPKTLTEQQLDVLRWVAQGCPDGVMQGYSHRISAAALRGRGLVKTSGRGETWTAKITPAGRDYLHQAQRPDAPRPRQPNTSVTAQLIDDLVAAGGTLRFPRVSYYNPDGVDYEQRARLAQQFGKVPDDKRLVVKPISGKVVRYHPLVARFRNSADRRAISRAALPRVLRILHGLIVEAERRGHRVELDRADNVVITVGGCSTTVAVSESGLPPRDSWEKQNRTVTRYGHHREERLPPRTQYEANATGRLTLALTSGHSGRPSSWSDRRSWTLEDKLPALLRELEIRAVEAEHRRQEAARRAAERRRAWQAAMDQARALHAQDHRRQALDAQIKRWRQAEDIRAYCAAADAAHPDDTATTQWISWARAHADTLDPLRAAPHAPPAPESVSPQDLRPYLDGWDPHGPDRHEW